MFQPTRPVELGAAPGGDAWAEFRVHDLNGRLALLRELGTSGTAVVLNAPDGVTLTASLWSIDSTLQRLTFSVDLHAPQLQRLVDADEVVAVAYLHSVKLQFELSGFTLVHGARSTALQCALPADVYRFQRRSNYRVRPRTDTEGPLVQLRHPALPDMQLALRLVDVSGGGCALWLPADVPPFEAGTQLGEVQVLLDAQTQFSAALHIAHVSNFGGTDRGSRLGCEWSGLAPATQHLLQRWIDRTQQRQRVLASSR